MTKAISIYALLIFGTILILSACESEKQTEQEARLSQQSARRKSHDDTSKKADGSGKKGFNNALKVRKQARALRPAIA
ncbi:MAG: hypothetical protein ACK57U_12040 [Planctomycetota bacterium]